MREKEKQREQITTEQIKTKEEPATVEQETAEPDEVYINNIYSYIDEFIERDYQGKTEEELKQDRAFFPRLIDYLYDNYVCIVLNNKYNKNTNYDISLVDSLFDIYKKLVYLYKWNNKPYIVEFALFTGINKNTFYNWLNGLEDRQGNRTEDQNTSQRRSDIVQNWVDTCERALLDGNDTIRDIFILKAKHGYRDNNNDIQITVNHKNIVSADVLPDLIGLNDGNN